MPADVAGEAEVDQRQLLRRAAFDLLERAIPPLHVDVRRRRRRQHDPARLDPDSGRVARIERRAVEVADVVRRVPRRREDLEPGDPIACDADVRLGHRRQLSPELVERVAVEPPCAPLEPRVVDEMRRTDLRDPDRELRMLAHENACRARVVEVDVREQQPLDVTELVSALREAGLQRGNARCRPAIEEGQSPGRVQKVRPDRSGRAPMKYVDWEQVDRLLSHSQVAVCYLALAAAGTSADARSAIRSSTDSIPTESRTRLRGAANGASAVEACVIRAGCSIRLSTPPSDSASWKSFVRPTSSTAASSESARNEIIPPKSRICRLAISWPGCDGSPG